MQSSSTNSMSTKNSNVETYSRVLPLSIRTAHELMVNVNQSSNNTNSSSSFGRLNNKSSPSSSSSTITNVRITLNYPTSTSITSSSNRQITLRLTNDLDPLFYFYLLITEQEYPALKQNQGLLVDFINFPSQLISLLDKCCDDKFILVLKYSPTSSGAGAGSGSTNSTILDIVESNPFKYLSHLSLGISPGSDSEVKKYLSELTVQLKEENEKLHSKFIHLHSSLESELSKKQNELERKNEELMQLREEMYKESTQSIEKYMRDVGLEKEKFAQFQNELTKKLSQEKNENEQKFREIISTLESKNSTYETEKYKLEQTIQSIEFKLKDSETKFKSAEDDIRLLNQELQSLRKNNAKLDSDYHEKQRAVGNLVNKLNCFETELKEKSNLITRQQELIASLGDKCRIYEERNIEIVRDLDSTKSQLRTTSNDLTKANEIIRKMQDDGRHLGKQLKTQSNLLKGKDMELNEKCRYLEETSKKLDDITMKYETNEKKLVETETQLEEVTKTVESQKETLANKETMITWLNKQLNQSHGLTSLSHFRQTLAASSTGNILQNSSLNDSVPLPSRLKSHTNDSALENNANNFANTSAVPSWMNLYSNNTGRPQSALVGGILSNNNTLPNINASANNPFSSSLTQDAAATKSTNNNNNRVGPSDATDHLQNEQTQKPAGKATGKKLTRPPTWAKPNKKVTLELGTTQPNWKH